MERVPFLDLKAAHRELREQLIAAAIEVIDACEFIGGSFVRDFERQFAEYVGARDCIGVGNGLDALTLALRSGTIGPGDEVIVPSNTFIATWLAVAAVGATIVPVDPDPGTFNISAAGVAARVTARTKAVIPVHLFGMPVDMAPMNAVAAQADALVIEDAAQAHGASIHGKRVGSFGNTACWSFYPGKNLGACGDAGAITTFDVQRAERLRALRNYGSLKKYHHDVIGTNSRLDELQAALLRQKLAVLDEWTERRRALAHRYLQQIRHSQVILPAVLKGAEPVWHLFVVRTPKRESLRQYLGERGIDTLIHYPIPPHKSGAFVADYGHSHHPLASALADEILSLPMGPHVTSSQAEWVVETINRWPG